MSFLVATLYHPELSFCDFDRPIMHEVCVGHVLLAQYCTGTLLVN